MDRITRFIIIDNNKDIYALVSKEVMAGQTVIKMQIDTNIKIITVDNTEIRDALFLGIDKAYARYYYNKSENAANIYSPRDSVGVQVISYFLN